MAEIEQTVMYLGELQKLTIEPGDIFILRVDGQITDAVAKRLRDMLMPRLRGHEVIVLSEGLTLEAHKYNGATLNS